MEFIQGVSLVHLQIKAWSGRAALQREVDVRLGDGGSMLPKEVWTGTKKVFPSKPLVVFETLRKQADRNLLSRGCRLMGGFAVKDENVADAKAMLDETKQRYEAEVDYFKREFDQNFAKWREDFKNHEESFSLNLTADEVAKRFSFGYSIVKVEAVDGAVPDDAVIADQILHEIGQQCKQASYALVQRQQRISQSSLCKKLDPMIDKLEVLSFGHGRLRTALDEFKRMRDAIPGGYFTQTDPIVSHLLSFLSVCSDEGRLELMLSGHWSVDSLLGGGKASLFDAEPAPQLDDTTPPMTPVQNVAQAPASAWF